MQALLERFPYARLFLHGNTLPEGINPSKVVFLPAPDTPPPSKGAQWLAFGKDPSSPPEGCLGFYAMRNPSPHLVPAGVTPEQLLAQLEEIVADGKPLGVLHEQTVETFAAHALVCYAKTRTPEARHLADALLNYAPNHSLWEVYWHCDTYQDYVEYVRWVAENAPDPMLVPLAHWPDAFRNLEAPPPPPHWRTSTAKELLALARKVMALPME